MVCHQYKTLSVEQNDKNKEYARNQYQNMSEKGKQKIKEYGKSYQKNMCEEDKTKKERIHNRIQKITIKQCVHENISKQWLEKVLK